MSLAIAESLPESTLFFFERLCGPQVARKLVHQFYHELVHPLSLRPDMAAQLKKQIHKIPHPHSYRESPCYSCY